MGAANSKVEEDKALQLCRERKKFVKQALDGRCSLAATHDMYIQSLTSTGTALRRFVESGAPVESSLYTSTSATPEPLLQIEKSLSHFSFSSPSVSQHMNTTDNLSPSPSPPHSTLFHANHMKVRGSFSKKVEEKPPISTTATVISSSTPQNNTPRSSGNSETSPFGDSSILPESPPWDYFGIFQPIDHQFSSQEGKTMNQGFESTDDIRRLREEEGIPDLEDEGEKASFHEREESQDSEDEFDEPATDSLVRSFENFNRVHEQVEASASPAVPSAESVTSETELLKGHKSNSPDLSPLRTPSIDVEPETDLNKTTVKEDCMESKIAPKDLVLSMKDIEFLFKKAYESGKEVPKMLEANKLHFRPIFQAKESGSFSSTLLKACFSCGEDPSQVQEEPAQNAVKYITWHRTTSSRSSSSRNLLGANVKDDNENRTGNLFDNFCMISGSHASTLDRLYAWERKLYDEVKASEMVRRDYDLKCKILRQLESKGENSQQVDKTRAVVKDLHSRIRVAIYRIDSISKRIEDIRDRELQPQLEELIHGLSRMWEVMLECHKLQFSIIFKAYNNGNTKISVHSESHRQITLSLEDQLSHLSSSFDKWINAQKSYLQSINGWLLKCVSIAEKSSKKKRRQPENPLRFCGPPIYATCGVWFDKLEKLRSSEVTEAIKTLENEIASFVPSHEKKEDKDANYSGVTSQKDDSGIDSAVNMLRDEVSPSGMSSFDRFQRSLAEFCKKLKEFAEASVNMYADVQVAIQRSKSNYDQIKSKSGVA
ncbi:protein ALTERED PHOSPHATE STARVATION RESPONSE 1 [Argentina anserina]|uniref:protein ALTERED PHOSPHATE STARVATION RESPONSE 1 n=1 Tax=Argentina anserina TaxID=57926 RepID=UPI0021767191|nr:protein ALTERED PHOSPHATE STARVATION RESPONSE 1 [Potentilla anserina]XP_050369686.1 protein ALTERED PHOSPHATE STARVATION RESPONSE 1 [Potentilla anserina]XP_050369687.1 protein ALTERED PHOSPHATE STARVATION RESPONSE 1 [Potentilla anserina]